MRKILAIIISMLLIPLAYSYQDGETINLSVDMDTHAGVLPSNPLWRLDISLEKIRLVITTNPNKREQLALSIAKERLAEMIEIIERGEFDKLDKIQSAYSDISDILKESKDVTDDVDFSDLENELRFESKLESHTNDIQLVRKQIEASGANISSSVVGETLTVLENNVKLVNISRKNYQNELSLKLKARFESRNIDAEIERLRAKYKTESQSNEPNLNQIIKDNDLLESRIKTQLNNQIDAETNIQAKAIIINKSG